MPVRRLLCGLRLRCCALKKLLEVPGGPAGCRGRYGKPGAVEYEEAGDKALETVRDSWRGLIRYFEVLTTREYATLEGLLAPGGSER
jgi:hypothetical protein